jgi:hypothetical protein
LRQLALRVGPHPVVAALEHDVVEVDGGLARRGHVHDPRRRRPPQQGQQQVGEQERRQVVDGEAKLIAVRAFLPPGPAAAGADPRVVHEDIESCVVLLDLLGETAYLIE